MKASVNIIVLAVTSAVSLSASAVDELNSFNSAAHSVSVANKISEQAHRSAERTAAAYNDVDSRDGTGRFNADNTFSTDVATRADNAAAAAKQADINLSQANAAANGKAYRNQIVAQQAAAMQGALLTQANQQRTSPQIVAGGVAQVNAQMQAAAMQGALLTQANQQRTSPQIVAGGIAEVNAQMQAAATAALNQQIANYGLKTNSAGVPVNTISASTLSASTPAHTINVAAGSLKPDTPVSVTINGQTAITTASALAPALQIAVPYVSAFQRTVAKGGIAGKSEHTHAHSGDNNGSSNAHSNAFGGHGLSGQRSGHSAAAHF